MLALQLLKNNKSVKERAQNFVTAMKRDIQREILDALVIKKEKIENELYELKDFSLETNLNAGMRQMTKDDCQKRFVKIIDLEFDLFMLSKEIEVKQDSYNTYFGSK